MSMVATPVPALAWHDEADLLGVRIRIFFFRPDRGRRTQRCG